MTISGSVRGVTIVIRKVIDRSLLLKDRIMKTTIQNIVCFSHKKNTNIKKRRKATKKKTKKKKEQKIDQQENGKEEGKLGRGEGGGREEKEVDLKKKKK